MVAGIISEYNPFHRGHEYHLGKTREAGASHIVCVMSGFTVQRGDFAILDPFLRARKAVERGADLVLELPPQFSLSPARDFAAAGVDILRRLGTVEMLSFGAETPDTESLKDLSEKAEQAELRVKKIMSGGKTYPRALSEALGEEDAKKLSGPNNTLAAEYLRAAKGWDVTPLAIKRTSPHDSQETDSGFASAGYIRRLLREKKDCERYLGYPAPDPESLSLIENAEKAILLKLSGMSAEEFSRVPYSGELAPRLYAASRRAATLEEIFIKSKSRNFTLSRVRRTVLMAVLGITEEDLSPPEFVRVLALNRRGAEILRAARKSSEIAVGSSLADLSGISPAAKRQAELTESASRLWDFGHKIPSGISEYRRTAKLSEKEM